MSAIYRVGDFFLKASTNSTVDKRYSSERRLLHPEDCVLHFTFLNALGHFLFESCEDGDITAPEQHLAVKIDDTHAFAVMDRMFGMISLDEWLEQAAQNGLNITDAPKLVKARIQSAVGGTLFEPAISDLFEPGELDYTENETIASFRADNIMVPMRSARSISFLQDCAMAIIDQPGPLPKQLEAAKQAVATYSAETGYDADYLSFAA